MEQFEFFFTKLSFMEKFSVIQILALTMLKEKTNTSCGMNSLMYLYSRSNTLWLSTRQPFWCHSAFNASCLEGDREETGEQM